MTARNPLHSCTDTEHYTPTEYVEAARSVLGTIDLDPASCPRANGTVCAARFYDAVEDGLVRPWGGCVYCNPPVDTNGSLVKAFWRRACEHALFGGPGAAVLWAGFSVEQLCTLQRCKDIQEGVPCPTPMDFPRVVLSRRIKWIPGRTEVQLALPSCGVEDQVVSKNKSPTHGNYFCLLGGTAAQRRRFRTIFSRFGKYAPAGRTRSVHQRRAG